MRLKYGFGRGCQQISVDVRSGSIKRAYALAWVESHEEAEDDFYFPLVYAEVPFEDVLERIGMSKDAFWACANRFTDAR